MKTESSRAAFSIPSILAVIAAICSFNVGAIGGFLLAGVAIICGILGILLALAPGTRGGVFSFLAIGAGFVGVIAAVIKAIMWFVNG